MSPTWMSVFHRLAGEVTSFAHSTQETLMTPEQHAAILEVMDLGVDVTVERIEVSRKKLRRGTGIAIWCERSSRSRSFARSGPLLERSSQCTRS